MSLQNPLKRWREGLSAAVAMMLSQVALASGSVFMPPDGQALSKSVDQIYGFLIVASAISFVLLIGGMIYFVWKYRRTSPNQMGAYITHNHTAEFLWSFIPFVIFMFVFAWGWIVYDQMRHFPDNALEIHVFAKKWEWKFVYKNGKEVMNSLDENNQAVPATLVVPVGRPVKLIMSSTKINPTGTDPGDRPVLHSFYIPAMRVKQDVVPGRFTALWFQAEQPGMYRVFCAEFCGGGHSAMRGLVKAVAPAEFDNWLAGEEGTATAGKELSLADKGKVLYQQRACIGCHSLDGSPMTGPTWKHIFGEKVSFVDGSSATVDENYIRESILNPNAKVVKGFPSPSAMPPYAGQLSDEEIGQLIEFIKTVK